MWGHQAYCLNVDTPGIFVLLTTANTDYKLRFRNILRI